MGERRHRPGGVSVDAGALTLEEARRRLGIPPPHDLTCELLVTGLGCTCSRARFLAPRSAWDTNALPGPNAPGERG